MKWRKAAPSVLRKQRVEEAMTIGRFGELLRHRIVRTDKTNEKTPPPVRCDFEEMVAASKVKRLALLA